MTATQASKIHKCEWCEQQFKREDHLNRHKLSHGKAKYRCTHAGCGMTFHRNDVLQRHQRVHLPDSSIKRRQPRRGTEPKPFVCVRQSSTSSDQDHSSGTNRDSQSLTTGSPTSSLTSTVGSSRFDREALSDLPAEALDFCSLHFAESCLRRFPFIHRTSLDRERMIPEKLLAMAVLGGCAIPEYRDATRKFFERAKQLLEKRRGSHLLKCDGDYLTPVPPDELEEQMSLFQAQVLLIECTLWSSEQQHREWAKESAFRLAIELVPNAVKCVRGLRHAKNTWAQWVYREQCVRALWAFYCTTQKARPFAPLSFSTHEVSRELWLPASNEIFEAPDEVSWRQIREASRNGLSNSDIEFKSSFYALLSQDDTDQYILDDVGPLGQHVLLSALFDQYMNSLTLPSNYDTYQGYCKGDLTQFKPRASFLHTMAKCRRIWWRDSAVLFGSYPPKSAELQNVLLLNYLEVLMYGGKNEKIVSPDDYYYAVNVACEIFCAMIRNGILEVASRACWLTDGASRYCVREFGRTMVHWAQRLQEYPVGVELNKDDQALYARCSNALQAFNREFPEIHTYPCLPEPQNMRQLLYNAWSIVLGIKDWVGDHPMIPDPLTEPQPSYGD